MICRVRIPTVTYATARDSRPAPYVELAIDDEVVRLPVDGARVLHGWMAWAAAFSSSATTRELADAIARALAALSDAPPRVIENHYAGIIEVAASSGEPIWIEVSVEAAVAEPANPRLVLQTADSPQAIGTADTWWLLDGETSQLAALIEQAASTLDAGPRAIGRLEEAGPNRRPFLHVSIDPDPRGATPGAPGVQLRFDDDLLDERADDGIFWLPPAAATRLATLLREALAWAIAHPAHVYLPPEPRSVQIAELRFGEIL